MTDKWTLGLLLGLYVIGSLPCSWAQTSTIRKEADTLTVDEAVRHALKENPSIQSANQQQTAAAATIREARSAWFPTVEGQAQYRRVSDNLDYTVDLPSRLGGGNQPVTFAPAILHRYSARAIVEQPLFTGFRIPNELEAARARTEAAEAQAEATKNTVAYETRAAYWRLYEAQAREEAARDALHQIERRLIDVRNRRAEGMATETDVLRVKARRDRVRVKQVRAQNSVRSARRALSNQINRPIEAPVVLADTVVVDTADRDVRGLVDRAREQHPTLAALRETIRARDAKVEVAQSSWFPQLYLSGSYLYARPNERLFPPEDRFQGTWEVGASLTWRLSLGGQTDAAADRAQAQRLDARYTLQDRRQAITDEVRTQIQEVKQTRAAVVAAETSVQSAREAYRSVQSRDDEGMAVVTDLLDAEQELREARAQLASAQADYALAKAALNRALGRHSAPNP